MNGMYQGSSMSVASLTNQMPVIRYINDSQLPYSSSEDLARKSGRLGNLLRLGIVFVENVLQLL